MPGPTSITPPSATCLLSFATPTISRSLRRATLPKPSRQGCLLSCAVPTHLFPLVPDSLFVASLLPQISASQLASRHSLLFVWFKACPFVSLFLRRPVSLRVGTRPIPQAHARKSIPVNRHSSLVDDYPFRMFKSPMLISRCPRLIPLPMKISKTLLVSLRCVIKSLFCFLLSYSLLARGQGRTPGVIVQNASLVEGQALRCAGFLAWPQDGCPFDSRPPP